MVQAWSYEHSYRIGPITDAIVRLLFNGGVVQAWSYEHSYRIGPITDAIVRLLFNGRVVQAWSYEHSYRIGPITDAIVRLLFNGRVVWVWPYEHRCRIGPMTAATGRPLFIDWQRGPMNYFVANLVRRFLKVRPFLVAGRAWPVVFHAWLAIGVVTPSVPLRRLVSISRLWLAMARNVTSNVAVDTERRFNIIKRLQSFLIWWHKQTTCYCSLLPSAWTYNFMANHNARIL